MTSSGWYIDSSASYHMKGVRLVLLGASKLDLDCYVRCGTHTKLEVREVGSVVFQLELGGTLKVARLLHVPVLRFNLLSVSILENMGSIVLF